MENKSNYLINKISDDIIYNIKLFNKNEIKINKSIDEILSGYNALEVQNRKTTIIVSNFLMSTSKKMFISVSFMLQSLQLPSCYPLIRGILESSIYAYYINTNIEKKNTYIFRNKNNTSKNENRKLFSIGKINSYLKKKNPNLYREFKKQYDNSIDKGAHPNPEIFRPYITSNGDFSYNWNLFETKKPLIEKVSTDIISAGKLSIAIFNDLYN